MADMKPEVFCNPDVEFSEYRRDEFFTKEFHTWYLNHWEKGYFFKSVDSDLKSKRVFITLERV
jgi:hypothetical protein